jgi:hypothetical protein
LIFLTIFSSAQDSTYIKRKLTESDIKVLFSYYDQDGNHSAVTGGEGTEKLEVYAPKLTFSHSFDSANTFLFDGGVDIITSASTDKIDFNMSSASYKDFHFQATTGYSRYLKKSQSEIGLTGSFALESDYLSGGFHLWYYHPDKKGMTSYYASLQAFFDDLRWGRRADEELTLVYPVELRDTNWFDIYMRYSYNIEFGIERVLNPRMLMGFYPGLHIQTGLLSTPFHRVYFQGEEKARVENFPRQRIKVPVGIKLNAFAGKSIILNSFYRFYADNFRIISNMIELAAYYKVNPYFSPTLSFRIYHQTGAKYFKPYGEHLTSDKYYTSDYDLSEFTSIRAGAGLRYSPYKKISSNWSFDEVELLYYYYWRSDGLMAHMITTLFSFKGQKAGRK